MKHLLGKAHDPAFWQEVRTSELHRGNREALSEWWKSYGTGEIPALLYSDYRRFTFDGNRGSYEAPYFLRRRMLNTAAVLALIYPEEEAYLTRLMDLIYAVCDEYTWCLPAHQTPLAVNNNRHVDLFAAETGMALSEIVTLLGDRLEPLILDRVRVEINRRIVESFLDTQFFWETVPTNWAAVCMGSVSCTFMLMRPELVPALEERMCRGMDAFLRGFGPDGVCEEGFSYWCYGFGFFTVWADMMRTFTDGRVDYFKNETARRAAPFLSRMYLKGGCVVSFSDAGRTGRYNPGVLHYLKGEYPDEVEIPDPAWAELMDSCARWCTFLRAFTWVREEYLRPAEGKTVSTYYAPSVAWLVVREENYAFAAKGGHNCEPHNHHDVGSFLFVKKGRQTLTDPGAGLYSRQYFSNQRYAFEACCSRGHSLPYFGTEEDRKALGASYGYQKDGKQYAAREVSFDPEGRVLTMDIAPAYGDPAIRRVTRTFTLTKEGFTLRDEFDVEAGLPVTERLVALMPYEVGEGYAVTDGARITFDPALCLVSTATGELKPGTPLYYLDLRLKEGVTVMELRVE